MSDKAGPTQSADSAHGNAIIEGITTALSWLTIVPVRGATVFDRTTGFRAIAALPLAGLIPGAAAVVWCLLYRWAFGGDSPTALDTAAAAYPSQLVQPVLFALLCGAVVVASAEALTRAMHIDGLADVVDALGSYKAPSEAQQVLRDPTTGPMGVLAVVVYVVLSTVGFAILCTSAINPLAAFLPFVLSRLVASTACLKRFPAMSATGFGALVAGTQPMSIIAGWWLLMAAGAFLIAGFSGVVATAVSLLLAVVLIPHFSRRLGGINGDILGALIEVTTVIAVMALIVL